MALGDKDLERNLVRLIPDFRSWAQFLHPSQTSWGHSTPLPGVNQWRRCNASRSVNTDAGSFRPGCGSAGARATGSAPPCASQGSGNTSSLRCSSGAGSLPHATAHAEPKRAKKRRIRAVTPSRKAVPRVSGLPTASGTSDLARRASGGYRRRRIPERRRLRRCHGYALPTTAC